MTKIPADQRSSFVTVPAPGLYPRLMGMSVYCKTLDRCNSRRWSAAVGDGTLHNANNLLWPDRVDARRKIIQILLRKAIRIILRRAK